MTSSFNNRRRRHVRAALVMVCALSLPVSTHAEATMDDMFGVMFRMMLVMMNTMSESMLNNNNSNWGNNLGGLNSFNMGMSAWPMMSGVGSPMSGFGSPWNSFGNTPWGMSPWNSGGGNPYGGGYGSPYGGYGNPYGGYGSPYGGGYGSPAMYGAPGYRNEVPPPHSSGSALEGRWYGNSGEVLEIQGNRFMLRTGGAGLGGTLSVENNIVNLYSPQTNTVTRYTFLRNQTELVLTDGSGTVLTFSKRPRGGMMRIF